MSEIKTYATKNIPVGGDSAICTDSEEILTINQTKNVNFQDLQDFMNSIIVHNDTGSILPAGTNIRFGNYAVGGTTVGEIATNADDSVISYAGINPRAIGIGETGPVIQCGRVRDIDTSLLDLGFIYLGTSGGYLQTRPTHPTQRLVLGAVEVKDAAVGKINLCPELLPRTDLAGGSYNFTSNGVLADTYWKGGFYKWNATDASLSQASDTVGYGTAGKAYAAHASIVAGGAGVVDTGQVGLRVTGTLDSEEGTQTAAQTAIITDDITTLTLNNYYETSEKFSGDIVFELYVVSGTPTAYSLDFNYGYSKYEDFQNRDFTVTSFEVTWQGGANDSGFDIALLHHKTTGWTYAATGFEPGDGDICRKSVDQAIDGNVVNGEDGAYKRTNLNVYVDGGASEGVLVQIITGANSTIQTADIHVLGKSEELLR